MKKLLLSLLLISTISANASEQAKPVVIKNLVDKTVSALKWLTTTRPCKFITDNRITNTFTQDEYVQRVWTDKLGNATLWAAPFYLIALNEMVKRPNSGDIHYKYDNMGRRKNKYVNHSEQIDRGFSALNWAVVGIIVHAGRFAYLNN
ncbi:MAG: hypothetical protein P4L22_01350 [Candidatus Babeliales bacterium]|nr:hypothetical protein [Candidatus Babeliales bacterium]